ncbi:ATP synthase F1 subunit gamma [Xiamenia xianingshaonis]|uniref:ATP synthase gamma chain n=1 Tax=Xiamenia xianingshaonis TaxID=2682776 RepID=A0A9E6SUM8_9ACTN|nr:ATP synthase F1 subunit gamma [Xiamenia xianingshaonis]NGM17581.1 ATP synthase F1 subunit gamma [Eggerthellaceae bacterium zg-893]NHM13247.1 ATP synthase F1 subunit gamma [Xiamenia xianingshaonis]NHM15380.1 ATP synthase F1 subunit gamma [Xiamenia xianingshaonis]QTU84666.1 ATP synthase F1 subunit gamma [Xiamenia xianingshaonis]
MPNLHDIERRINSVSSTKQITRTMQMVAAAKIRKASERVLAATPYSESMVEMLANVAKRVGGSENALLRKHDEVKHVLLIAVVSDRGLAGGFNSNVLRRVERLMQEKRAGGAEVSLVACGKKAIGYFTYRKVDPVLSFPGLSADPTVEEAASVAAYAIDGYTQGDIDEVIVVYNHAKNAAEQTLREEVVLPVDTDALEAELAADGVVEEAAEQKLEGDVIFEPNAAAVLDRLLPSYVRTTLYHALIDSAAAEQGARRNAMMSATDNATEMVETLTRLYNRVRQGAITTEISEIVGGAAALEE